MEKDIKLLICAIIAISFISCNNPTKSEKEISVYEKAYQENFESLLTKSEQPYTLADTLYTEMYIALKAANKDDACGDIVIDRVNKLLQIDPIEENQRHYIEAASIVYSMRKDYENYWKLQLCYYNTYPPKSFERLSSYALYYTFQKSNADSASYYLEEAKIAANDLCKSKETDNRIKGCLGLASLYVVQNDESYAKKLMSDFLRNETDSVCIEAIQSTLNNFDMFKRMILKPVK